MDQQVITLLGATGSIGCSTLDVVRRHPEQFQIYALVANQNVTRIFEQILEFSPVVAVLKDEQAAEQLARLLQAKNHPCRVETGESKIIAACESEQVTTVVAAIVGAAGLKPTLAAAKQGKRVLLANKESLVMAGRLFMECVSEFGAELLPVDSEHNAIFQCLPPSFSSLDKAGVERILLTGSGGPFRASTLADLSNVTVEQACAHPNWDMGQKISVDSATMMNKGLEYIEACWLFGARPEQIEVLIHPQSVVHSMVRYVDGSVIAQMGQPDMRTPIAHCLGWPQRIASGVSPLSFTEFANLTFEPPDYSRFPCLKLAIDCMAEGGTLPAALNAANEVAVQGFLDRRISFLEIAELVKSVVHEWRNCEPQTLDEVLAADHLARECADRWIYDQKGC